MQLHGIMICLYCIFVDTVAPLSGCPNQDQPGPAVRSRWSGGQVLLMCTYRLTPPEALWVLPHQVACQEAAVRASNHRSTAAISIAWQCNNSMAHHSLWVVVARQEGGCQC